MLSNGDRKGLEKLCLETLAQARSAGRPLLACFAFARGETDLLEFAQDDGAGEPFRFYWERPGDAFGLVAGGIASRHQAKGPGRFREIAAGLEPMLKSAVNGGCSSGGPYALGGFSFFDEMDDSEWPGFGAAQMVVPKWILVRHRGAITAMISRLVAPDAEPAAIVEEMADDAMNLKSGGSAPAHHATRPAPAPAPEALPGWPGGEEGRGRWRKSVVRALAEIRAGRLSKVVLARTLDVISRNVRPPLPILKRLRHSYPDCFNFMINPGAGQIFLGASPEQLARFENGSVHMGALAGTTPRGRNPAEDEALAQRMLESSKERSEHQIVVDGIVNSVRALGRIERPPEPHVVKLSNVQHLHTPITLHAKHRLSVISMIERLHPTPAVGGFPGPAALEQIRKSENFERGWYAGPVGWMNARGEGEFAVALRACTLKDHRVRLFAGNGIVADSDPEQEYRETQLKMLPVLSAIRDD